MPRFKIFISEAIEEVPDLRSMGVPNVTSMSTERLSEGGIEITVEGTTLAATIKFLRDKYYQALGKKGL